LPFIIILKVSTTLSFRCLRFLAYGLFKATYFSKDESGIRIQEIIWKDKIRKTPLELEDADPLLPWPVPQELQDQFNVRDEVEIQWRQHNTDAFGWWRGFIESIDHRNRWIFVIFPQFPPENFWYRVKGNLNGEELTGPTGLVGGIRKVSKEESEQWAKLFTFKTD